MGTRKTDSVQRYIVTPDKHVPFHDLSAWRCVIKAIGIVKPHGYIDLGDFWEGLSTSHWQWKKKKRPPLDYQLAMVDEDLKVANNWMDDIDEALDKANVKDKRYITGNHDDWIDRLVEENPHLERTKSPRGPGYLFADAFDLRKRGYKVHPIGEYVRIGKLYYYHGHHHGGIHHAKNHLLKLGVSVMYGHWHDIQEHSITHVDGQKAAWSIGCLKSLRYDEGNEWLGRRPVNWGHAFAIVDYWDGGHFNVQVHRIIDGKCVVNGEIVDGTKGKTYSITTPGNR